MQTTSGDITGGILIQTDSKMIPAVRYVSFSHSSIVKGLLAWNKDLTLNTVTQKDVDNGIIIRLEMKQTMLLSDFMPTFTLLYDSSIILTKGTITTFFHIDYESCDAEEIDDTIVEKTLRKTVNTAKRNKKLRDSSKFVLIVQEIDFVSVARLFDKICAENKISGTTVYVRAMDVLFWIPYSILRGQRRNIILSYMLQNLPPIDTTRQYTQWYEEWVTLEPMDEADMPSMLHHCKYYKPHGVPTFSATLPLFSEIPKEVIAPEVMPDVIQSDRAVPAPLLERDTVAEQMSEDSNWSFYSSVGAPCIPKGDWEYPEQQEDRQRRHTKYSAFYPIDHSVTYPTKGVKVVEGKRLTIAVLKKHNSIAVPVVEVCGLAHTSVNQSVKQSMVTRKRKHVSIV